MNCLCLFGFVNCPVLVQGVFSYGLVFYLFFELVYFGCEDLVLFTHFNHVQG
jgi:hypothetical protein